MLCFIEARAILPCNFAKISNRGREMNKDFETPTWLSRTIAVIGISVGALALLSGIVNLTYGGYSAGLGSIYLIFGIIMIGFGIYDLVMALRNPRRMAMASYFTGCGWCLCNATAAIFFGVLYCSVVSNGAAIGAVEFFVSAIFLVAVFFMGWAAVNIKNGKPFKNAGMTGSIIFIVCSGISFIMLFVNGSDNFLSYLLDLALIGMAVLLLFLSRWSRDLKSESPFRNSIEGEFTEMPKEYHKETSNQEQKETPKQGFKGDEDDKIRILKAYKDLLDSGVITQEDFDKKKESLLS